MEADDCERKSEVARAYREVASGLTDLAERFEAPGEDARAVWREIASGREPQVSLPPELVIGNYDALVLGRDPRFAGMAEINQGYLALLRRQGVSIVEVASREASDCRLPLLVSGSVQSSPIP